MRTVIKQVSSEGAVGENDFVLRSLYCRDEIQRVSRNEAHNYFIISLACSNVAFVIFSPPDIRAISSTRWS